MYIVKSWLINGINLENHFPSFGGIKYEISFCDSHMRAYKSEKSNSNLTAIADFLHIENSTVAGMNLIRF